MATADRARWMMDMDGTWLCLRVPSPAVAKQVCETFAQDKMHELILKKRTRARSLDANAYFWVLVGKLAAKLRIRPDEIYRQYVPDVGDNFEIVPIQKEHIEDWDRMWCAGHIGRLTDDLGECRNIPGYHYIRCYFGQSDYDTAQMSRLIDMVVQDCKAQGIETMTPEELRKLVSQWE